LRLDGRSEISRCRGLRQSPRTGLGVLSASRQGPAKHPG
jgi:hypothetical protein